MNIKIKNQHGEWVEAAYTLDGDDLLVESKEEVFVPKNGDVVVFDEYRTQIMICKSHIKDDCIAAHVLFDTDGEDFFLECIDKVYFNRRATEEEKILLFNKMGEEGYEWDAEKKEVRKKRWKPKLQETYYHPFFLGCNSLFHPEGETWLDYSVDTLMFNLGWCFKTVEECQDMCNKLNEAIRKLQLCESNDTK